ncbi:MAG TPA: hypothetical protein VE462_04310 [Propionibacteriaceae bacterium]|jgi:hypothetical protein|nr:hypothetical protein [Propionibacteriaceae bacterium]
MAQPAEAARLMLMTGLTGAVMMVIVVVTGLARGRYVLVAMAHWHRR